MSRGSGTREATEERFAERAAHARTQRVRRWLLVVVAVVVTIALAWAVGFSSLLDTREVSVTGADPADAASIERIADEQVGRPLVRVDGDDLARRITDEVPGAAHVTVERSWPHTLNLKVTPRVPALAVERGERDFELLDLDGVVIRHVTSAPEDVPTVTAEDDAEVSGHGVKAAQGMLAALPAEMRSKVKDVRVDSADQISFRLGSTRIIWGDGSKPEVKVEVIRILQAKKAKTIDVSAPDTPVTSG